MNKKLIISLSIIGAVAAIAISGTIAYFSDTETSTGNTFTAGAIDLTIDNKCYYSDGVQWGGEDGDCNWEPTDLDGEFFFNFSDLKPGDWGEDTVSVHVDNNDAWACVTFDGLVSSDNDCTEPELEDEPGCTPEGVGELAENLEFRFWADMCDRVGSFPATPGDNIYQPNCDIPLMQGYASELGTGPVTYTLADSEVNNVGGTGALVGGDDYYIGKVWCFGSFSSTYQQGGTTWRCEGSEVYNESQTDSLTGDIIFYAEQSRNNSDFLCSSL